jgi:Cation transporting ATPase, C-terminus/Cation transporter/ATPase, N-terminus
VREARDIHVPEQSETGLSEREAAQRLVCEGPILPEPERRSGLRIAAEVVREPMFALLLGAAVLYPAIGDLGDALVLLAFVSLVLVNVAVIFANRTFSASLTSAFRRPNWTLWWVAGGALTAMLSWPGLRDVLELGPLHADDLPLSAAIALGLLIALETGKAAWGRRLTT